MKLFGNNDRVTLGVWLRMIAAQEVAARNILRSELDYTAERIAEAYRTARAQGISPEINEHKRRIQGILSVSYKRAQEAFGARVFDAAGKLGLRSIEAKRDMPTVATFQRIMREWVDMTASERADLISGTTDAIIRRVLQQAIDDGLSADDIALMFVEATGGTVAITRAATIALTEVHMAASASNYYAASSLGIPGLTRSWLSAEDGRTRPAHAAANGQTIGMNGSYTVDGEKLKFPGDPNGSAENVIRCRCTETFDVDLDSFG